MVHLPIEFQPTIQKALEGYTNQNQMVLFEERELLLFREYISGELSQEHGSIQKQAVFALDEFTYSKNEILKTTFNNFVTY